MITFQDISAEYDTTDAPWLDKPVVSEPLTSTQIMWRQFGVALFPGLIPDPLIDAYCDDWMEWHSVPKMSGRSIQRFGGWSCPTPYMHVRSVRDLCLYSELAREMRNLMGEEMGLHLNLTGWVSTQRQAHQDTYLNPPHVKGWYMAAWIALDDVHPDSGPFEYVPGSHRWPTLTREGIWAHCEPGEAEDDLWPTTTERFVVPALEAEVERRGGSWVPALLRRGDVLLWHANLVHRGSRPRVPGTLRKSCIAHYSALSHREDMPQFARHAGAPYFYLTGPKMDDRI